MYADLSSLFLLEDTKETTSTQANFRKSEM